MRCFVALAACMVSVPVLAQRTFVIPHVLEKNGQIVEVVYDFEGGQPTLEIVGKAIKEAKIVGNVKVTASSESLRMLANCVNGTPIPPEVWTLHRSVPGMGGIGGGQLSFVLNSVSHCIFPAMDVAASEAAYFQLGFEMQEPKFDGFFTSTPAEKQAIKTQKKWLPANFRVSLGDMPTSRVSKVHAFTIKQSTADVDGDGRLDYRISDPILLTIPAEDADPYRKWRDAVASGVSGTHKTLSIEYQDSDGTPVLTVILQVEIVSADFEDILLGTTPTPGREFRIRLHTNPDAPKLQFPG